MYKSAESVSPKHPDKICDRISDAILDAILMQDPNARVAVETMGGHGKITIMGEVTTTAEVDYEAVAHGVVDERLPISVNIVAQSPEIAQGVDTGGAGDQGIMVGYACADNEAMIPQEAWLSRQLNRYIYEQFPFDGKTQITLKGNKIDSVVASFQNATHDQLQTLVEHWLEDKNASDDVKLHLNPAGDWHQGGFDADVGLTGRKLAVDNYGPHIPVGGGCFSGKDPSKVDRSAAYMARRIAVDYLKKHSAQEVFVHLAYAIGLAEPMHAEATVDGKKIAITEYDLTPNGIIEHLGLKQAIYAETAEYGHFGNGFVWDN